MDDAIDQGTGSALASSQVRSPATILQEKSKIFSSLLGFLISEYTSNILWELGNTFYGPANWLHLL